MARMRNAQDVQIACGIRPRYDFSGRTMEGIDMRPKLITAESSREAPVIVQVRCVRRNPPVVLAALGPARKAEAETVLRERMLCAIGA
jgi:hypothetical protein